MADHEMKVDEVVAAGEVEAPQVQVCTDRSGLDVRDVGDAEAAVLERLYREVLQPSFPPAELVTFDEFRNGYPGSPDDAAGLFALRDGAPAGAILGDFFPRSRVLLVSYLAVRPSERGTGLGGVLLSAALSRWPAALRASAVLAEVEDPRFHRDSGYGDPVRRLRFYERHGAWLLPLPYLQPSLRPGAPRVRGLLLISFGGPGALPSGVLTDFLDEYFAGCEGAQVTGDPEYRALRDRYAEQDPVVLWPLRRAAEVS